MKRFLTLLLFLPVLGMAQSRFGHGALSVSTLLPIISDSSDVLRAEWKVSIADSNKWTAGSTIHAIKPRDGKTAEADSAKFGALRVTRVTILDGTLTMMTTAAESITVAAGGIRNEGGLRQKGASTFGATGTPTLISATGEMDIGTTTDNTKMTVGLTIDQGTNDDEALTLKSSTDISQPFTTLAEANTYATFAKYTGADGGLDIRGYSDNSNTALSLLALCGGTSPTLPAIRVQANRQLSGTTWGALTATQQVIGFYNYTTSMMTILGSGYVGFGTTSPAALLHANNSNVLSKPLFRLGRDKNATPDSITLMVTGSGKLSISPNTNAYGMTPADTLNLVNIMGKKSSDSLLVVHNDIVGRDSVFAVTSTGKITTTGGVDIATGKSLTVGAVQWDAAASDSINGANIAARTITDLMLPAALTAKSAGVSDADYGDVTVSTGAWAVEDDSHNHTSATTKFVIGDSLRVEETSLLKGTVTTVADMSVGTKAVINDSLRVEETALLKGAVTANTKLVVNDSLRVEETAIIKGDITAGGKVVVDDSLRVEGPVKITGDVTWDFIHFFGMKEDTTVTPDCNGNGVYTKINGNLTKAYTATSGLIENDGFTAAGDSITIITPGDYKLSYSFTMVGGNATDWKIAVFKNGVKQYGVRRTTTGATNYSGGTLPFYLKGLVADDDISFRVTNLTNPYTDDPTFTNLNLLIEKIPED